MRIVEDDAFARIEKVLIGKTADGGPRSSPRAPRSPRRTSQELPRHDWFDIRLANEERPRSSSRCASRLDLSARTFDRAFEEKKKKLTQGDDLPPGVLKMVKVYVAVKRRLQPGDKMAGRHGNKGVISRIVAGRRHALMAGRYPGGYRAEPARRAVAHERGPGARDPPRLGREGTGAAHPGDAAARSEAPAKVRKFLDKIYNSTGKKEDIERFTDDEMIELARNLQGGLPFATPVFDGATEEEIKDMLELAGLPRSGQITLFDGRTGEAFDRPVTVGYMYMLKLHHLVDDKMHARSTGPYSLVTQQPLGGKAQFGGQRFGEMEVWALEAYGAAYTLQEMLTVKSDDTQGRTKVYENIVKGEHKIEAGMPESFNVLVKEIRSLAIDIDLERY